MTTEDEVNRRLKFYGLNDHGTYFQLERAAEILEHYDPSSTAQTISDILELHNAQLFAESNLFPESYTESQRTAAQALIPELRKTVAKYFNRVNDANVASIVVDVDYEYHGDLLELLAQYKAYDRCAATTLLPALEQADVYLGEMLTSRALVRAYDPEVRARLLADPANAEHLIRKYLEKTARQDIYLPPSLTRAEERALLNDYLDSEAANPNFVELVSLARIANNGMVDAKMKLKAQRQHEQWTKEFFEQNSGIETGCEVAISGDQTEPATSSQDGLVGKLSYSRTWLEDGLDYPTILNNFIYLFEFTDRRMVLTLPSYHAQLGVVDRFLKMSGQEAYLTGAAFHFKEQSSFLQTAIYDDFLRSKGIELESVIAWFFADYLKDEFGAANFTFAPSSKASTYLERCRHIFAEMESVVRQFSLYVEHGELDRGLLAIASEQVRYKDVPSLVGGKYVYPTDDRDITNILHLLFSDQSGLTYINEALHADNAARLIVGNKLAYGDFADYQKGQLDYLIQQGVLKDTGERVQFASTDLVLFLKDIFDSEAASYYHYSAQTRGGIDEMIAKGWLVRRSSLLTEPEARYFNYQLNQVDYSNGPDLRNKYLHGSQANADAEDEHHRTYITALKLLLALVIKMNDDFCLHDDEKSRGQDD
jgi:hypothetical protein